MLTSQKITKKNMPQLKAAAKKFVKQYGEQSVRASMGQFSGNTVFGIFDGEDIVGRKVVSPSGKVLSEIGTTTVTTDDAPVFQRAIDPFAAFEEAMDDTAVEETLHQDPDEQFASMLLDNAQRNHDYLTANPNAGRRMPQQGGYTVPIDTKKPAPKSSVPKIIAGIFLAILVLAGGFYSIHMAYNQLQQRQAELEASQLPDEPDWDSFSQMASDDIVHVQITSGDDVYSMRDKLASVGAVSVARDFVQTVDAMDAASLLQAGDYIVSGTEDAQSVVARMAQGKRVPTGVMGINEGDTLSAISGAIDNAGLSFNGGDFLNSSNDVNKWRGEFSMLSDVPQDLPSLEGYFTEGEYNLAAFANADDAVRMLLAPIQQRFESSGMSSVDFHNMLTKASLIEKEALFDEDRTKISSVIDNRINAGAPLQIDAAVQYANGQTGGRVYDSHLEVDSPYNTYQNVGLPIGPICSGIAERDIEAALHPEQTDYFYYVLKDTEGHHEFCVTPEEFETAKQHYLEVFGYEE